MQLWYLVLIYRKSEESELEDFLTALQQDIGGTRSPYDRRAGALDLVSFLELVVVVAGISVRPVVQKYFEGLLNADGLKKLGEKHRSQLLEWFGEFRVSLSSAIGHIHANLRLLHTSFTLSGKEMALALEIPTAFGELYVVLNHQNLSPRLLKSLPGGIVSAIRFIYETGFPDQTVAFQLYYDSATDEWPYLFAPTTRGFGNHIDRYVDLRNSRIEQISSSEEFRELFRPAVEDEFKFLVSPLRGDDIEQINERERRKPSRN